MVDIQQNKRRLLIVGAHGLARELESWISFIPEELRDWELGGFLFTIIDINPLEGYPTDFDILGDWDRFQFRDNDICLIGVADPIWREKIYHHLKDHVEIGTFIAHNAIIGKHTIISEGSIICPNCIITTNVNIGKGSFINIGSQIGHDVKIGSFCSLMANVDVGGFVEIGSKVFIGTHSTIIPHKKIADGVKVGAGSVVINSIRKQNTTVFGNPAKYL